MAVAFALPDLTPPSDAVDTLFDLVERAGEWNKFRCDGTGKSFRVPGTGWARTDLNAATHRFVIDPPASATILAVATLPDFWLGVDLSSVRLPSRRFWLEWSIDADSTDEAGCRQGILVSGDEGGFSGTLTAYFERSPGSAAGFSSGLHFDLTQEIKPGPNEFGLRHSEHHCLDGLFTHVAVSPIGSWSRVYRSLDPARRAELRSSLASYLWHQLPVLFVFLSYLEHDRARPDTIRGGAAARNMPWAPKDERLQSQHSERNVIYLGSAEVAPFHKAAMKKARLNARRRACKAHAVRGHFVTRGKTTFWRSSHVRGDSGGAPRAKIVEVRFRPLAAE